MKIRCMIIDDEPLAQDVIVAYIERVSFLTLVARCENVHEAVDVLQKEQIDLIFCDIKMPEISGVEFVKSLRIAPCIIFISAFAEYALEGYNVDAADYLLKPVAFERFFKSVIKVKSILLPGNTTSKHEALDHLFVKEDYKLVKINHADILYVEGMKDYVKIFTTQKLVLTHITMKGLESMVPSESFMRVHKSFIIRLGAIKAISGNMIELINDAQVPIGLQYRDLVMNHLNRAN